MKKGIFIWCRSGQIAPFLIIIIVILLIATMALVNIGKVGTYRVNTSNAADAGAVAGASMIASTQNAIADANAGDGVFNTGMLQGISLIDAYTTLQTYFFIAPFLRLQKFYYLIYLGYTWSLFYNYMNLLYMGYRGIQDAQAQAHQLVFSNLQIEEAAKVERTGQAGIYRSIKSDFTQWVESQDFQGNSFTYSWRQYALRPEEGRQVQESEANWVRSDVQNPSANALLLIPMPVMPLINNYIHWIPACNTPTKWCACINCSSCYEAYFYYYQKVMEINGTENAEVKSLLQDGLDISIGGTSIGQVASASGPAGGLISLITSQAQGMGGILTTAIQTKPPRPCVPCVTCAPDISILTVIYWVPIPYILAMSPNEANIGVEVTRYEPSSNLGLFQNRAEEVKSGARATTYGGSVFSPHSYRIRLEDVW